MSSIKFIAVIMSLAAFVLLSNVRSTEAAYFSQHATFHPAHPGKCFDKITRRGLLPNKEYKPKGICAAMTCDLDTQTINIETCPYIEMPGCEEVAVDPNWTFPKCCPQFKCTDFKTGNEVIFSA